MGNKFRKNGPLPSGHYWRSSTVGNAQAPGNWYTRRFVFIEPAPMPVLFASCDVHLSVCVFICHPSSPPPLSQGMSMSFHHSLAKDFLCSRIFKIIFIEDNWKNCFKQFNTKVGAYYNGQKFKYHLLSGTGWFSHKIWTQNSKTPIVNLLKNLRQF